MGSDSQGDDQSIPHRIVDEKTGFPLRNSSGVHVSQPDIVELTEDPEHMSRAARLL